MKFQIKMEFFENGRTSVKIFVKNNNLLTVYEYHIYELLKLVVKSLIKCTVSLVETKPLVFKNLPILELV